ncbi:MAG TPA: hypothetical protein VFR51_18805, partial [Pyrinomonadaceae bacterium]|nr:hypothetical protein [Pyrinomonadaceae bacterium]
TEDYRDPFKWQQGSKFTLQMEDDSAARRKTIADRIGSNEKRDALNKELGLKFSISVGKTVAADFLTAPQTGTLELCQPK